VHSAGKDTIFSANPENVKKQGGFAKMETVAGQGI